MSREIKYTDPLPRLGVYIYYLSSEHNANPGNHISYISNKMTRNHPASYAHHFNQLRSFSYGFT